MAVAMICDGSGHDLRQCFCSSLRVCFPVEGFRGSATEWDVKKRVLRGQDKR